MKPGELERQLSHLGEVARVAQARLAEVAREVDELRGMVVDGPTVAPAPVSAVVPGHDRSGAGAYK